MDKRYLWVVEFLKDGKWFIDPWTYLNRTEAREEARKFGDQVKTRVRKYVPEGK